MGDIKRGGIYYIAKRGPDSVGHEQYSGRPAVVVSNDRNNACNTVMEVVYLTTQPKLDSPTHVTICSTGRKSIALCEQVTSVAAERFGAYKGQATADEMKHIDTALAISLGLTPYPNSSKPVLSV